MAIFASIVGTIVGAIAGYRGGKLDDVLMRITDLFLAFPILVLLLVLRNVFAQHRAGCRRLFGGLKLGAASWSSCSSASAWMAVARIVRGVVLSLKEREFVEAARRARRQSSPRIVVRHLIPNSLGPIMVALTTSVVGAILAESTLSFFGYGSTRSTRTSWGPLLADAEGRRDHRPLVAGRLPVRVVRADDPVHQLRRRRPARRLRSEADHDDADADSATATDGRPTACLDASLSDDFRVSFPHDERHRAGGARHRPRRQRRASCSASSASAARASRSRSSA